MRFKLRLVAHTDPIGDRTGGAVCEVFDTASNRVLAAVYETEHGMRIMTRHVVSITEGAAAGVMVLDFSLEPQT